MDHKPIHYERVIRDAAILAPELVEAGIKPFSWMDPEVKRECERFGDDLTYFRYTYKVIQPFVSRNAHIVATIMNTLSKSPGLDEGWMITHLMMEYHTYMFNRFGRQVFSIMPTLARMLVDTDLDVDTDLLKMPHRSIYLTFPPDLFRIWNQMSGVHNVEGIYVCEDPWDIEKEFKNLRTDTSVAEKLNVEQNRVLRVLLVGSTNNDNALDDALFHFRVDIGPGTLGQYIEKVTELAMEIISSSQFDSVRGNKSLLEIQHIFRFVANVLLYISSSHPDVTKQFPDKFRKEMEKCKRLGGGKSRKGKRAAERARRYTSIPRIVLGANIPKDHYQPGTGSKVSKRFKVKGHWRTYTSMRYTEEVRGKTVWIKPFYKGPEMADELDRRYKVGSE